MITEDYCSYEVAKLLKEKGFEQHKCQHSYDSKGVFKWSDNLDPHECSAPTHQMTMKWLREVHNIFILIERYVYDYINEKSSYVITLWQGDNLFLMLTMRIGLKRSMKLHIFKVNDKTT